MRVQDYESFEDLESLLDAIAEAATGSTCGIENFSYRYRGNDLASFTGQVNYDAFETPDGGSELEHLTHDDPQVPKALKEQYILSDSEVAHALASIGNDYGQESILEVLCSNRVIHSPAYPNPCTYVRVVVEGFEIAYWTSDEWSEGPQEVMGALLGAGKLI